MIAGGTIRPNRFVKISTSADNTALEADANEAVIGASTSSNESFDSDNHATSGDEVTVRFGVAFVEAGGNITRGGRVESDADGKAVAATNNTTLREIAGWALESGADGGIIKVMIHPHAYRSAIA